MRVGKTALYKALRAESVGRPPPDQREVARVAAGAATVWLWPNSLARGEVMLGSMGKDSCSLAVSR